MRRIVLSDTDSARLPTSSAAASQQIRQNSTNFFAAPPLSFHLQIKSIVYGWPELVVTRGKLSQWLYWEKNLLERSTGHILDVSVGGSQNLERRNAERPIFRNIKIANIKITKHELFDNFIFEFDSLFFRNHLNTQNIQYIFKLWNTDFSNGKIKCFFYFPNY